MKSIEINYFRCFKHMNVELTPGINLFIGDNASGKTSLLLACKYAVNCLFAGFSTLLTSWKSPVKADFRRVFADEKKYDSDPIEISFVLASSKEFYGGDSPSVEGKQTLIKKNNKTGRPNLTWDYRKFGAWLKDNYLMRKDDDSLAQLYPLPLVATYSTQDIHSSATKIDAKLFREYSQSPAFGYYHCSATDGLLQYWVRRLLMLKEADRNPVEMSVVMNALQKMFGPIGCDVMKEFDVRVNFKDIVCIFNDGRETPVSILSDGYRRLFSIVIDIAFRCAILNSLIYGVEAGAKTSGTVIIDEIDLHLHPSMQAKVLKALQSTFPNLQFIVTTHAPMVMAGVESDGRNCVQYMDYSEDTKEYSVYPVDTFGMDMSTLSETVLRVPRRDPAVGKLLQRLSVLVDNEDYDAAKSLLSDLKSQFGDKIPELSMLETEILVGEELQ
ncbi:MAG: AAA family ATPase [Muribaculum sp.]|nr:AAA family ATPase [Muribaculum sp.]